MKLALLGVGLAILTIVFPLLAPNSIPQWGVCLLLCIGLFLIILSIVGGVFDFYKSKWGPSPIHVSFDNTNNCQIVIPNLAGGQVLFFRARVEADDRSCQGFLREIKIKNRQGKWVKDPQYREGKVPLSWALAEGSEQAHAKYIEKGQSEYLDLLCVTDGNVILPGTHNQTWPTSLNGIFQRNTVFMLCVRTRSDKVATDINIIVERASQWDQTNAYTLG